MTQDFSELINAEIPFHAIYFDLKAAFDKVDHTRLIDKISTLGIHTKTIDWLRNFLQERTFRVRVDDELSASHQVTSGVPQGGALSPLLYIIFVLDLAKYLPAKIHYLLYADDIKIYGPVRNSVEAATIQAGIDGVARWCSDNYMLLSPSKCAVLIRKAGTDISPTYSANGETLPVVHSIRDLGILMSADLDFNQHISNLVLSARRLINNIFRCFIVRRPEFYLRLYNSLVISKFMYCAPIWLPYKAKHWLGIETVQRYFLRRLRLRCPLGTAVPHLPSVQSVLEELDEQILRRILLLGQSDCFFDVTRNNRRSHFNVAPKSLARNNTVLNHWSRRVCSKVSSGHISPELFMLSL